MLRLLWVVPVCLLFAIPAVAGEQGVRASTPTSLYFHINGFQDFPINTQAPDDDFTANEGIGLATHSTSCAPRGTPVEGAVRHAYHTYYGFSSPSFVEYNFTDDGSPRIHLEGGLAADVSFDPAAGITLHWFLSTQTGIPPQGLPGEPTVNAPVVVPEVVVRATLRTGTDIFGGDENFNSGRLVAQGESAPALLAGAQSAGAQYDLASDGTHVYGFAVPLTFADNTTIPAREGFSVRIDVFEKVAPGVCDNPDSGYVMTNLVRVHTSPGHRPRLELANFDALTMHDEAAQLTAEGIQFRVTPMSPWGAYDVAAVNSTLKVIGPDGVHYLPKVVVQQYYVHGDYGKPKAWVWVLNVTKPPVPPGTYTGTISFTNLQHTANATAVMVFELEPAKSSPAPTVAAFAILALATACRRTRLQL